MGENIPPAGRQLLQHTQPSASPGPASPLCEHPFPSSSPNALPAPPLRLLGPFWGQPGSQVTQLSFPPLPGLSRDASESQEQKPGGQIPVVCSVTGAAGFPIQLLPAVAVWNPQSLYPANHHGTLRAAGDNSAFGSSICTNTASKWTFPPPKLI